MRKEENTIKIKKEKKNKMTRKFIFTSLLSILIFSIANAQKMDCNKFEKFSAKYIECNAKNLKETTSQKLKNEKKKFDNSSLKDKLIKFKNSKSHAEFMKK